MSSLQTRRLCYRSPTGFTLIDLAALLAAFVVMVGLGVPAIDSFTSRRKMPNATQVRQIQSSMVLYATGNNNYYPGLAENGDEANLNGRNENGYDVAERYEELLQEGYFDGDLLISIKEPDKKPWKRGRLTTDQYSFALLAINDQEERAEWRDTINPQAIVVSDRVTAGPGAGNYQSLWSTDPDEWRGAVAFNDNHVLFLKTALKHTTRYGDDVNEKSDDLFTDDDAGKGDAIMAFYGDRGVFP